MVPVKRCSVAMIRCWVSKKTAPKTSCGRAAHRACRYVAAALGLARLPSRRSRRSKMFAAARRMPSSSIASWYWARVSVVRFIFWLPPARDAPRGARQAERSGGGAPESEHGVSRAQSGPKHRGGGKALWPCRAKRRSPFRGVRGGGRLMSTAMLHGSL